MNEHILIAGCGDLGRRTAQHLIAQGHEVWGLRRTPPPEDHSGLRWIAADLSDPASLAAVPRNITCVIFMATPDSRDEAAYRRTFIEGTAALLDALDPRVLKRIVFISSSAVYGEHGGEWVDEETPAAPVGFNGRLLLQAENALRSLPFETVILRLSGIYGPGRLQLLKRLQEGRARAPRSTPHWSNRIHIDDAAAAVAHLVSLANPRQIYLGTDDTPLELHVLYDYLAALLHAPPVPSGPSPVGVGSKRLRNTRLRDSGLTLQWPDSRAGYAALINEFADRSARSAILAAESGAGRVAGRGTSGKRRQDKPAR